MTKAEWVAGDLGFERDYGNDKKAEKHDGSCYEIRAFKLEKNGNTFVLLCDNYYGASVLYRNGNRIGDIEYRYEDLPGIVAAK